MWVFRVYGRSYPLPLPYLPPPPTPSPHCLCVYVSVWMYGCVSVCMCVCAGCQFASHLCTGFGEAEGGAVTVYHTFHNWTTQWCYILENVEAPGMHTLCQWKIVEFRGAETQWHTMPQQCLSSSWLNVSVQSMQIFSCMTLPTPAPFYQLCNSSLLATLFLTWQTAICTQTAATNKSWAVDICGDLSMWTALTAAWMAPYWDHIIIYYVKELACIWEVYAYVGRTQDYHFGRAKPPTAHRWQNGGLGL